MKKIFALAFVLMLTACWDMGTGNKVGVITRLNKEGLFCNTWEAEIIRGGMNGGSGNFGQAFPFTVESDALAQKVQEALDSQQEVKIYYRFEFLTLCRATYPVKSAFLTNIEVIRK
jgi:hypothetical protein